jgi:hypothetical protein
MKKPKVINLKELYYSKRNQCCKCGCFLETADGIPLGSVFVLDMAGKFYCTNCDNEFDNYDERIYDADVC